MRSLTTWILTLTALCALPGTHAADIITWGPATTISGNSDVMTTGTLLYAYNLGGAAVQATTVNGVTFSPFSITGFEVTTVTVGDVTIAESPDFLFGEDAMGSTNAPFASLSTEYKNLLKTAGTAGQYGTITLTLGGLSPGQAYAFQWWCNDSTIYANWTTTTATAGNAVTLDSNPTDTDGNIGQFAIGNFTASGTSTTISLTAPVGAYPMLNALQLRVVPEPSTWILGTIAAGVMLRAIAHKRMVVS